MELTDLPDVEMCILLRLSVLDHSTPYDAGGLVFAVHLLLVLPRCHINSFAMLRHAQRANNLNFLVLSSEYFLVG